MNTTDCEKIEDKLAKHHSSTSCCGVEDGSNNEDINISSDVSDGNGSERVGEGQQYESEKEKSPFNSCNKNNSNNQINTNNNNNNINNLELTLNITIAPTPITTNSGTTTLLSLHNDKEQQQLALLQQQQQQQNFLTAPISPKELAATICSDDSQPDFDDPSHPLSERWSPLGANYDDAISPSSELLSPESELELLSSDSQDIHCKLDDPKEMARLRNMEDEQEVLTSSLLALTSHFAHVQLRVRQIVEAPSHERDQLLKDLEEFAFRGIPEPMSSATDALDDANASPSQTEDERHAKQQQRQFELIDHLKTQLSELEKIAYESGAPVLPQHMLLEKQKIIIDELKHKLNLKVEEHDLSELSPEELKNQVDNAFGEFVGPLKMKEQLVAQLKTQITDLERFIAFLQCGSYDSKVKTLSSSEKFNEAYNSYAAKKKGASDRKKQAAVAAANRAVAPDEVDGCSDTDVAAVSSLSTNGVAGACTMQQGARESLNSKAHGLMDKASLLMQMFATTHFGTKQEHFQKNTLKKTSKGNHWGDLRAQLEVDIQEVASLAATLSFDREKLANMKRALRKSAAAASGSSSIASTSHNGILTTIPPRGSRVRPSSNKHQSAAALKPYTLSSDSDEDELDTFDCYDWERHTRRGARLHLHGDSINTISKELTTAVRKNFAMTLLRLMQHGLRVETESATSSLIVPFMRCLNPSPVFASEHSYRSRHSSDAYSSAASTATYNGSGDDCNDNGQSGFLFGSGGSRQMHAWELILEYYYLKHGDEYNNTPARKLSQSFNLDIVDAQAVSAKQNLLSAVGMIIAMHRPYKRSYNAHFKAFICAALNSHQLVEWLNLIFSCNDLVDTYYTPNSYVVRTGFRDSLRSIDTLSKYDFDLPVDLSVRHFRNI